MKPKREPVKRKKYTRNWAWIFAKLKEAQKIASCRELEEAIEAMRERMYS